ncbi:hypothetical protein DGG96_16990 [Legionella qingyii]|uniref:Uncharacterized protein n=1 Tax=Legionella qingyii TaxID=2184757 RepID=A0A317TXZ1_9GAMM|nr:hypothetical protein [Legionella qingyii]PWY54118.1 hypothetical protein DGG96_18600 [Legionella qingyii]PWY54464.1 hypothetical protein DGG96_16990 [Legionella qingyii]RUR21106.1 hypothetical protein ELY20_13415 [Legionella qingyii]HDP0036252.1 hypothetical protein [Legionella pneumophila]
MGILQVFSTFLEDTPSTKPEPGSIYWVPTPNVEEVTRILDIERATPDEHCVTNFEIKQMSSVHFTSRERLPIKKLNLGDTEELIISKGKKRPVIILSAIQASNMDSISSSEQRRLASQLEKTSYLVAPFFSISTMLQPGTFGPILVARIRALHYPQFFCLPESNNPEKPNSIIRLDRVFPTYLGVGCKPMGKRLHPEPFELLLSQFSIVVNEKCAYDEPYQLIKGLAQEALPDDLKLY